MYILPLTARSLIRTAGTISRVSLKVDWRSITSSYRCCRLVQSLTPHHTSFLWKTLRTIKKHGEFHMPGWRNLLSSLNCFLRRTKLGFRSFYSCNTKPSRWVSSLPFFVRNLRLVDSQFMTYSCHKERRPNLSIRINWTISMVELMANTFGIRK